jgi:hypothetical protein
VREKFTSHGVFCRNRKQERILEDSIGKLVCFYEEFFLVFRVWVRIFGVVYGKQNFHKKIIDLQTKNVNVYRITMKEVVQLVNVCFTFRNKKKRKHTYITKTYELVWRASDVDVG